MPRSAGDPGVDVRLVPAGDGTAVLDPFPFSEDETTITVPARTIEDRRYEDDDDLRVALDEAPWATLEHTLRRAA